MATNIPYRLICTIGYIVTLTMSAPTTTAPDLIQQVHEALISETTGLTDLTQAILDRYKIERFKNADVTADGMTIIGLPDVNQLTQHQRMSASEGDLIQTRIDDLQVFHDLLENLEADERVLYREDPANFVDEFQEIRVNLQRVLNKAVSVISTESLAGQSLTTYSDLTYNSITAKVILQFYTLKTLESAYYYLVAAERDFVYLAGSH